MRRFSWQRGLTRGISEFLALQLPGLATEPVYDTDPDKGHEYVTVGFSVAGVPWRIKVETPAERGPLGMISIVTGPEKITGPIDSLTWEAIGKIIRTHSQIGAPA